MAEIELEVRCEGCGDILNAYVSTTQSAVEIEVDLCRRCLDDQKGSSCTEAYEEGYGEGYEEGYSEGYDEGYRLAMVENQA